MRIYVKALSNKISSLLRYIQVVRKRGMLKG